MEPCWRRWVTWDGSWDLTAQPHTMFVLLLPGCNATWPAASNFWCHAFPVVVNRIPVALEAKTNPSTGFFLLSVYSQQWCGSLRQPVLFHQNIATKPETLWTTLYRLETGSDRQIIRVLMWVSRVIFGKAVLLWIFVLHCRMLAAPQVLDKAFILLPHPLQK